MNIRDVMRRYANTKRLHFAKEVQLPPGIENMCCEVYNPGTEKNWNARAFSMLFESFHETRMAHHFFGMEPAYWLRFVCHPGEWVFLPHGQYSVTYWNGTKQEHPEQYRSITNVGDAMFKGNKLPSRPDEKKIRQFTV